jgi:hypothetical protein
VSGRDVQGIHRVDARFCRFLAGLVKDRLQVVVKGGSLEITLVEAYSSCCRL